MYSAVMLRKEREEKEDSNNLTVVAGRKRGLCCLCPAYMNLISLCGITGEAIYVAGPDFFVYV